MPTPSTGWPMHVCIRTQLPWKIISNSANNDSIRCNYVKKTCKKWSSWKQKWLWCKSWAFYFNDALCLSLSVVFLICAHDIRLKFHCQQRNVVDDVEAKGFNPGLIVLLVVGGLVLTFLIGNYVLYLYAQKTLPPKKKKPVSKKKMKRERLKQGISAPGEWNLRWVPIHYLC